MFYTSRLLLGFLICFASNAHSASDYEIAPGTLLDFTYKIAGVSFQGKFFVAQSKFSIDFKRPENSVFSVELDTKKSSAGFYLATQAMLGSSVLNSQKSPIIKFFSTDINLKDGQFQIHGRATIKGITDHIEIFVYLKEDITKSTHSPQEIQFLIDAAFSRKLFKANGYETIVGDRIELKDDVLLIIKKN